MSLLREIRKGHTNDMVENENRRICNTGADFCKVAPRTGFEPVTFRLGGGRSIQLSYRGEEREKRARGKGTRPFPGGFGGAEENRTLDLRIANATLSQLSYGPGCRTGGV